MPPDASQAKERIAPVTVASMWVHIYTCHRVIVTPPWMDREVASPYWRIYANHDDVARVRVGGREIPLEPETMVVLPEGVSWRGHTDGPMDHFFVHFNFGLVPGVPQSGLVDDAVVLPRLPEHRALLDQIAPRPDGGHEPRTLCLIHALVYMVLAAAFDREDIGLTRTLKGRTEQLTQVRPAVNHILRHLHQPLSNAELAELCHLSESWFIRTFRQGVGQTPTQFILNQRVIHAADQLVQTDRSIDQIAQAVGFANRFHFTREFTRRVGRSPALYRKNPR